MAEAVLSIADVVSVGGIGRASHLFPVSLGAADIRRNWKTWGTVACFPGRVKGFPEIFGWMLLDRDDVTHADSLDRWDIRPVAADEGSLVVMESKDPESWFAELPLPEAVVREAQRQFADVLWDPDRRLSRS